MSNWDRKAGRGSAWAEAGPVVLGNRGWPFPEPGGPPLSTQECSATCQLPGTRPEAEEQEWNRRGSSKARRPREKSDIAPVGRRRLGKARRLPGRLERQV